MLLFLIGIVFALEVGFCDIGAESFCGTAGNGRPIAETLRLILCKGGRLPRAGRGGGLLDDIVHMFWACQHLLIMSEIIIIPNLKHISTNSISYSCSDCQWTPTKQF